MMLNLLGIHIPHASITQPVLLMVDFIRSLLAPMPALICLMGGVVAIFHLVELLVCGIGIGCLGLLSE